MSMNITVSHPTSPDQSGYIVSEGDLFVFYRAGRKGAAHPDLETLTSFLSSRGWILHPLKG